MTATLEKTAATKKKWWQRPWIGPLGFLALAFIAFSLPP